MEKLRMLLDSFVNMVIVDLISEHLGTSYGMAPFTLQVGGDSWSLDAVPVQAQQTWRESSEAAVGVGVGVVGDWVTASYFVMHHIVPSIPVNSLV